MTLAQFRRKEAEKKWEEGTTFFKRWSPPHGSIELWFKQRGITPTLAEYREVAACAVNGANPLGIH